MKEKYILKKTVVPVNNIQMVTFLLWNILCLHVTNITFFSQKTVMEAQLQPKLQYAHFNESSKGAKI